MVFWTTLALYIRKVANGIGNRPALRSRVRPFPVHRNIASESDNENTFSILGNAVVNGIDKPVLHPVF